MNYFGKEKIYNDISFGLVFKNSIFNSIVWTFLYNEITNNYILIKDLLRLGSWENRRQIETMLSVLGKPRDSMYLPEHMESHKLLHVIKT